MTEIEVRKQLYSMFFELGQETDKEKIAEMKAKVHEVKSTYAKSLAAERMQERKSGGRKK